MHRGSKRGGACAAVILAAVLCAGCSASTSTTDTRPSGSSVVPRDAARSLRTTSHPHPATVTPSPPPPPFGYCGGLRTPSDARYITTGGAAVALVRADVDGRPRRIRHVNPVEQLVPLDHVRVLAGSLSAGPLTDVEAQPLPRRPYLLVVGSTGRGGYFVALGEYGVYAVHGRHAYRTCTDFTGRPSHLVRRGITTIRGLTRLFSRALR